MLVYLSKAYSMKHDAIGNVINYKTENKQEKTPQNKAIRKTNLTANYFEV